MKQEDIPVRGAPGYVHTRNLKPNAYEAFIRGRSFVFFRTQTNRLWKPSIMTKGSVFARLHKERHGLSFPKMQNYFQSFMENALELMDFFMENLREEGNKKAKVQNIHQGEQRQHCGKKTEKK